MHMHILHIAVMTLVVHKSIVHVLLLKVVMKWGQLLGWRQQLSCYLRVGLFGLVQLLLEV